MRRLGTRALAVGLGIVAILVAAPAMVRPDAPTDARHGPTLHVGAAEVPRDAAHAVLVELAPAVAGDEGIEGLVADALAEQGRAGLVDIGARTGAELVAIRKAIAREGLPDVL